MPATRAQSNYCLIGPAVRMLLHQHKLDIMSINATGPKKNLLKSDVFAYINDLKKSQHLTTHQKPNMNYNDILSSNEMDTIGHKGRIDIKQFSHEINVPHSHMSMLIPCQNLFNLLKLEKVKTNVSFDSVIIKASALALKAIDGMNVYLKENTVFSLPSIDVSISLSRSNDFYFPILPNADRLSLEEISLKLDDFVERSHQNKLIPEEIKPCSFTIINLEPYGISESTAFLKPNQSAILTIGSFYKCIVPLSNMGGMIDERGAKHFLATLSYDIRVIDELTAQRFLTHLKMLLAAPKFMTPEISSQISSFHDNLELEGDDGALLKALL